MAEVITRLKLESGEYDAKIKRATQGLLEMERECRNVGGTLAILEKDQKQYVQALGKMETVSRTVKGKLNELTQAYTELSVQYKRLTDEEKKGDFGKALASSLEQLKGRINETKGQLGEVNTELGNTKKESNSTGNALEQLAGKFGMNLKQITSIGTALAAGTAALKVAKDAFMASEQNVDAWGRTVEASESIYRGFLNALNTGDISGYLSNIDTIVEAAKKAYDELDRLGTQRTIQAPQLSAQQAENERMRNMLQTGRYIAPLDGRRATHKNRELLTPEELKQLEKHLANGVQKVVDIVGSQVRQSTRAINAIYTRQSGELGMSSSEFRRGTSSMAEFDKRIAGARAYEAWQSEHSFIDQSTGKMVAPRYGNPYESYKGWSHFRVDGPIYNELVNRIQEREQQKMQAYGMQSQAYRTMNRVEGVTVRGLMGGGAGGGGGHTVSEYASAMTAPKEFAVSITGATESMKELRQTLAEFKAALDTAKSPLELGAAQSGIAQTEKAIAAQPLALNAGLDMETAIKVQEQMDGGLYEQIQDTLNQYAFELNASLDVGATQEISKDGEKVAKSWGQAAQAVGQLGSAFNAVEDPAAKVAGTIMQAIASIALGFATASAKEGKAGIIGWIVATVAGLATMMSTIAAVKSATKGGFAEGGIVPGNNYSGDMLRTSDYGINSGELVLNRAQTNTLADQLTQGGEGRTRETYVRGDTIYLALTNYMNRTGKKI